MEFQNSQTLLNLARSFAGEAQARTRYSLYAQQAREEGLAALARSIDAIAVNELAHARAFMAKLKSASCAAYPDIKLEAGYPFEKGGTPENLSSAVRSETEESSRIYPAFARIAENEGFNDVAALFGMVASVEAGHAAMFTGMYNRLSAGTLYTRPAPVVWKCTNCGFEMSAANAWEACPLCGYKQGWAEVKPYVPQ